MPRLPLLTLLTTLLAVLLPLTAAAPPQPWYEKYHQRRVTVPQSYYEGLTLRRQTPVQPGAVRDVVCVDPGARFVLYDEYAAALAICAGGIAGAAGRRCEGRPAETVGRSGAAEFRLAATERGKGATINVSKAAWARCVSAARVVCPEGSFEAVCVGGATRGDVAFRLSSV